MWDSSYRLVRTRILMTNHAALFTGCDQQANRKPRLSSDPTHRLIHPGGGLSAVHRVTALWVKSSGPNISSMASTALRSVLRTKVRFIGLKLLNFNHLQTLQRGPPTLFTKVCHVLQHCFADCVTQMGLTSTLFFFTVKTPWTTTHYLHCACTIQYTYNTYMWTQHMQPSLIHFLSPLNLTLSSLGNSTLSSCSLILWANRLQLETAGFTFLNRWINVCDSSLCFVLRSLLESAVCATPPQW